MQHYNFFVGYQAGAAALNLLPKRNEAVHVALVHDLIPFLLLLGRQLKLGFLVHVVELADDFYSSWNLRRIAAAASVDDFRQPFVGAEEKVSRAEVIGVYLSPLVNKHLSQLLPQLRLLVVAERAPRFSGLLP